MEIGKYYAKQKKLSKSVMMGMGVLRRVKYWETGSAVWFETWPMLPL